LQETLIATFNAKLEESMILPAWLQSSFHKKIDQLEGTHGMGVVSLRLPATLQRFPQHYKTQRRRFLRRNLVTFTAANPGHRPPCHVFRLAL
jgi:hypothetical protein